MRFAVTVVGIGFAVFLMVFQGSLLAGFSAAASKLVDSTDSDLWITARGVLCFDFAAILSRRFMEISEGVPGVQHASRIVIAYAEYRSADGKHHAIALIGADPGVGSLFPLPYVTDGELALQPHSVLIDQSNAEQLEVTELPLNIEINEQRATVLRKVTGFSSFLGSPYVFTSYSDAVKYLGIRPEDSMYILLRLQPGYSAEQAKDLLQKRLPEVDVRTQAEFSQQSKLYWLTKTGAGGSILVAAFLGFLVGLVVVSQTMYANTMERLEEFATLKALGASKWFVMRIVLTQAILYAGVGSLLGLLVSQPTIHLARTFISWMITPLWVPVAVLFLTLIMCVLAAVMSIKAALNVEPARVFRA
jgi:putative ABC transport system permease protein